MARHYQDMLDAAQELLAYDGYLSTAGQQERNQVQNRFNNARRVFVYALFKERTDKRALWPSVSADLNRLEYAEYAEYAHAGAAFDYVRAELERDIGKQMDSHPIVRFAIRWGPPVGVAVAGLVYLYVKWQAFNG